MQASLFPSPRIDRMPTCPRDPMCQPRSRAEFAEPVDCGGCINTEYRCVSCGATGVESVRKDLK
jgi:hypothetical protein